MKFSKGLFHNNGQNNIVKKIKTIKNKNKTNNFLFKKLTSSKDLNIKKNKIIEGIIIPVIFTKSKKEQDNHWMSVARLRYPMMSVKKDNYEAILTACYLHDKYENEKRMVFA